MFHVNHNIVFGHLTSTADIDTISCFLAMQPPYKKEAKQHPTSILYSTASPSVSGKPCNLVSIVGAAERTPSKSSFLFILAGSHNGAVCHDLCVKTVGQTILPLYSGCIG